VSVAEERIYFEILDRFLERLEEWKETVSLAAEAFGVPEEELKKVLSRIEAMEEEALHAQIFGF